MREALGKRLESIGLRLSGEDAQGDTEEKLSKIEKQLTQSNKRANRYRRQLKSLSREWLMWNIPEHAVCAEIGVDKGEFSRQILDSASPRELHLIDPWEHHEDKLYAESLYGGLGSEGQQIMDARYEEVCSRFSEEIDNGQVKVHRAYSDSVASEFDENYFDWVYIDANHQYEFVKSDLEAYYPKVKEGGQIAGDDYGSTGWWQGGVQKAVDEFVSERNLELNVRHTQYAIRIRH